MVPKNKVSVITLGCSKNTVDSERLIKQLELNNVEITNNIESAETIIINTCGFIEAAKEESINSILSAVKMKGEGKLKKVIVAGCLSARYMNELGQEIPEVDKYFGTEDYEGIVKEFGGELKYELLGERELSNPSHFAYLKISEGCDNPCSFCAIPLMRGKHKSRSIESLISEAQSLAEKGTKEIIIIGQDTTDYGIDLYGKRNISELLTKLNEINGLEWIRLLYAFPSRFPDDLFDVLAANNKILKYIDMPLQHIADNVLKSMRRGITSRRTRELVYKIKDRIPDIALRTTFITGYPNETDKEFDELCRFIEEIKFDRVGVFTYSIEENTPAFILGDTIPPEIKEERKSVLMEIQKNISLQKNASLMNRTLRVLIDDLEGTDINGFYAGRSYRDAPEVDGNVLIPHTSEYKVGHFYNVRIYDYNEYDIFGKIN